MRGTGNSTHTVDQRVHFFIRVFRQTQSGRDLRRVGIMVQEFDLCFRRDHHMVTDRSIVPPQSQGINQNEFTNTLGKARRQLCRHHSAKGVADQIDLVEAQRSQHVIVIQHQVPQVIELV